MVDDKESIELLAKQAPLEKPTKITAFGWTAERELLATIVDVLSEMHATLIQVNSEKGRRPAVEHVKRPTNVLDVIEHKQIMETHRELVAKLMGR